VDSLLPNSGPFKVSSVHRGRITGYNPVDNLFLLSFEQHILDQPFLRLEDVVIGSKVEGTVEKAMDNGIVVKLAEGITGWIPLEHTADILPGTTKKHKGKELVGWEKRFKEGAKVSCKVLSVNLARRRILLTTKKTLLNSTLPPLMVLSTDAVGKAYHGTIVSITPHGAVVEFFSDVRGFLHVSEMSEAFIADATQHFRIGQTVKTWILTVDIPEKRMRLSLKDQSYWEEGGKLAFEKLEEGSIVQATITAKLDDKLLLDLICDGAKLKGIIHVEHLADIPGSKCEKKLAKFREGAKIKEVLVLNKNIQQRIVTCSIKPALIEAVANGAFPSKHEEMYRGREVKGWVKNVEDFGGFVAFAGPVEGVVHSRV
jgi:rRNA biogenesis protein RRP5